jgi:hypothetical protein
MAGNQSGSLPGAGDPTSSDEICNFVMAKLRQDEMASWRPDEMAQCPGLEPKVARSGTRNPKRAGAGTQSGQGVSPYFKVSGFGRVIRPRVTLGYSSNDGKSSFKSRRSGEFPETGEKLRKAPLEIRGKCGKEFEKSLSFDFPKLLPGEH